MGYIIINDDKDMDGMRSNMRRSMRGGGNYRHYGTTPTMHHGSDDKSWEHGYRMGYKHGWEDSEEEEDEHYRRARDSRGRFI